MFRNGPMTRQRLRRTLPLLFGLGLFALGLWALYHMLGDVRPGAVLAELRTLHPARLAGATAAMVVGYVALIGYDWCALRLIDRPLPPRAVALGSFLGFAMGNTVGVSVVSGGAVRYRIYAALGLDAFEVASVSSYIAAATGVGLLLAGLGALAIHPGALTEVALPETTIRLISAAILVGTLVTLYVFSARGAVLKAGRVSFRLPRPGALTGQIAISLIDIGAAALCLWLLLPEGRPDFVTFTAIFAGAMVLGLISHVPGGVGVFETAVLAALPGEAPLEQAAAALVMFRVIYYLLPFAVAFLVVSLNELRMAGGWLSKVLGEIPATLRPGYAALSGVVPAMMAVTAFGMGVLLVLVSLVPSLQADALAENEILAALLLEGGTMMSAVSGVALLILSHGLLRRLAAAYWLTLAAIALAILAALMNNLDLKSMAVFGAGGLAMLPFRRVFYRQAKLTEGVFSARWWALVSAAVLAAVAFFLFAHRATPFSAALWTEFAPGANTPRSLRAGLAASAVMLFFVLGLALQPTRPRRRAETASEALDHAARILETEERPQACLALTGDKTLMFSEGGDAFLMYSRQRSAMVVLGDPVGPEHAVEQLAWRLWDEAQKANCRPVFYEVSHRTLPVWIEMGLSLHKVGEEAVVHLPRFSLGGSKFKTMRAAYNKKKREGLELEILQAPHAPELLDEIEVVSRAWLGTKGREKGFSIGRFDRGYLNRFPLAVIRREGRVLAFANVLAPGAQHRIAIDLMRYLPDEASGMMEFLFVSLMEHYRDAGALEFSLGVAPLAGLSERRTPQMWNQFGRLMFEHGGAFYNFEGLRGFKQKFQPEWRPRYIALAPGTSPMVAMADIALLIAGGARGILKR